MLLDEISQGHTVRAEQTRQQKCRCCPLPCNDTFIRTQKHDLSWSLSSASQVGWMAHQLDRTIELHTNHSCLLHHHGTSPSRPLATLLFLARKTLSPASTPNPTPRATLPDTQTGSTEAVHIPLMQCHQGIAAPALLTLTSHTSTARLAQYSRHNCIHNHHAVSPKWRVVDCKTKRIHVTHS
jgi:hypothetical protein